jgi:pentatricopeptide repeat protein
MINGHVAAGNSKEVFHLHDEMIQKGFASDDKFLGVSFLL